MTATGSFNETRELMGKKWQKIDPWEIKVGDRVKVKHDCGEYKETTYAHVAHTDGYEIGVGPYCFYSNKGTWYIRKPKKPKPLARPDEPPVFPQPTEPATVVAVEYDNPSGFTTTWTLLPGGEWAGFPYGKYDAEHLNWESGVEVGVTHGARSVEVLWPKPTAAVPLTRPDEPPVGSLFRINRTGNCYCRADGSKYVRTDGFIPWKWVEITEPGDTIQLLKLVAVDE